MTETRTPYIVAQPRGRFALVAAERPRVLVGNGHVYRLWPDCLEVRYPDGAGLTAAPQDTPQYRATAAALGYRDVPGGGPSASLQMAWQHDVLHVVAAQWLGAPTSPLVRAVATATLARLEQWQIAGEESLVAALSRFLNTGYRDPVLTPLALALGVDGLEAARRHLAGLFAGMGADDGAA